MKKYVALVLFAVMVLTLIPTASALTGTKVLFDNEVTDPALHDDFAIAYASGAFTATVNDTDLTATPFDAFDAKGKPYYYIYLPVPSGLQIGGYLDDGTIAPDTTLTIDGVVIKKEQLKVIDSKLYVRLGKVDLTKGLSKTFSFVLTHDGTTVTSSAKVNLTVKDSSVGTKAKKTMAVAFTKQAADGVAIYTKGGTVYVDIAYVLGSTPPASVGGVKIGLTYGGKNIVPKDENAYIIEATGITGVTVAAFTSEDILTGTITLPSSYPETKKITLRAETRDVIYEAKDIPIVFRRVSMGDPKGIVFVDGEQKNVKLGDKFTLDVKGKEATLFETVEYIVDPMGGQLLYTVSNTSGAFEAIGVGSTYVRANYKYLGWVYSATIKVVISDVPATTDYYVVCRALNVRKGPGTNYGKAGLVYRNDVIKVIEVSNGWAKIWYKDNERYVSFKYLAIK